MSKRERLIEHLENMENAQLLELCREINGYDGSMDFVDTIDLDDICNSIYEGVTDRGDDVTAIERFMNSIIYGNVHNVNEPVRYNGYGNLENVTEGQLELEARGEIADIATWLEYNYECIDYEHYDLEFLDEE